MDNEQASLIMNTLLGIKQDIGEVKADIKTIKDNIDDHGTRITTVENQQNKIKWMTVGAASVLSLASSIAVAASKKWFGL